MDISENKPLPATPKQIEEQREPAEVKLSDKLTETINLVRLEFSVIFSGF